MTFATTGWVPQGWAEWFAFIGILAFLFGLAYFMLRSKLGVDFVPRTELMSMHAQNVDKIDELKVEHQGAVADLREGQRKLGHRVANVEQILAAVPTRSDLSRVETNMGELAVKVAANGAKIDGLKEGQDRTHEMLTLVTNSLLPRNGSD